MSTVQEYIEALKEIEHPQFSNPYNLVAWQGKAINIIVRIYGPESIQEEQIKQIKFKTNASVYVNGQSFGGGNNLTSCREQASEIIQGFISDLSRFGLPLLRKLEKNDSINIAVNQHQQQNQTVNINIIWDSIKEELTGKQAKEIEEVLKSDDSNENKKNKIITKLKSFGTDVVSNIIANIITNPALFG